MKYGYVMFWLFFFCIFSCTVPVPFRYAELEHFVSSEPSEQLCQLLNFLYFSYLRSYQTLAAQAISLKMHTYQEQLTHNIIATRRNPSKPLPFSINFTDCQNTCEAFFKEYSAYLATNHLYTQMLEHTVTHGAARGEIARYIKHIRKEARTLINTTLSSQSFNFASSLENIKTWASDFNELEKVLKKPQRGLIDFIQSYIPLSAAAQSMTELDRKYTDTMKGLLYLSFKAHQTGNTLWEHLEAVRVKLYRDTYKVLYKLMEKHHRGAEVYLQAYNNKGLIPCYQRNTPLPHPSSLD